MSENKTEFKSKFKNFFGGKNNVQETIDSDLNENVAEDERYARHFHYEIDLYLYTEIPQLE